VTSISFSRRFSTFGRSSFLKTEPLHLPVTAAQAASKLKAELKKYLSPQILILDELGYLPIDKHGADLLFQVISQRYEQGLTIITSNKAFKNWPEIFNNDSTLTLALLDRLLHYAETQVIEGKSYRMKDQIET
jgi:DNA replication protein DnaC